MAEVNIFADNKALGVFVRQYCCSRGLGLADRIRSSRVVQEDIMYAAAIPCIHSMGTTEGFVTNKRVTATVIVSSIIMCTVVILL
jgi:hypothetical protein